jgi:hypothetical protein
MALPGKLVSISHSVLEPAGQNEEKSLEVLPVGAPFAVLHLCYMPPTNGTVASEIPTISRLDIRMSRAQLDATTVSLQRLAAQFATMTGES